MSDRLDRLIAAAAACRTCGEEHEYRRVDDGRTNVHRYSWASPADGHPYSPLLELTVEWMRRWSAENPAEPAS